MLQRACGFWSQATRPTHAYTKRYGIYNKNAVHVRENVHALSNISKASSSLFSLIRSRPRKVTWESCFNSRAEVVLQNSRTLSTLTRFKTVTTRLSLQVTTGVVDLRHLPRSTLLLIHILKWAAQVFFRLMWAWQWSKGASGWAVSVHWKIGFLGAPTSYCSLRRSSLMQRRLYSAYLDRMLSFWARGRLSQKERVLLSLEPITLSALGFLRAACRTLCFASLVL